MKPYYIAAALLAGLTAILLITFGAWIVRRFRMWHRERMMQKARWTITPFRRRWKK